MGKVKILLNVALFSCISLWGCNKTGPDPCDSLTPFEASFSMGVYFEGGAGEWEIDTLIASDTVINKKFITFIADEVYDSYEWHIGEDPRVFTENRVSLLFSLPEDSIRIQLIAKKKPNQTCFPNDNGIDTVVHYLTIIKKEDNPIIGIYKGYLESDPSTAMEVEITYDPDISGYQIYNINEGCSPTDYSDRLGIHHLSTYKVIYFAENLDPGSYAYQNNCADPRGWAVLDESGRLITISYSTGGGDKFNAQPEQRTYHIYHGEKQN